MTEKKEIVSINGLASDKEQTTWRNVTFHLTNWQIGEIIKLVILSEINLIKLVNELDGLSLI